MAKETIWWQLRRQRSGSNNSDSECSKCVDDIFHVEIEGSV